jgi:hypothetical protein
MGFKPFSSFFVWRETANTPRARLRRGRWSERRTRVVKERLNFRKAQRHIGFLFPRTSDEEDCFSTFFAIFSGLRPT